jgi:hypothetical protein
MPLAVHTETASGIKECPVDGRGAALMIAEAEYVLLFAVESCIFPFLSFNESKIKPSIWRAACSLPCFMRHRNFHIIICTLSSPLCHFHPARAGTF